MIITNTPASLKARLAALSTDILAPGDFHDRLAPAIRQYSELMFSLTGITVTENEGLADISTDHGRAIGIFRAGLCINEIFRTQRFCRGLYQAVKDKLQRNINRPVHVIYAGTGPFATLALPVIMQFKPTDLQFTLLEINNESYKVLNQLIKTLDIGAYVRRVELCNAITWKSPDEDIDIVLSETMNRALIKEPQINIMLNMVSQLPPDVTYIPEEITVGVAMHQNHGKALNPLKTLYSFNKQSYRKIIMQSAGKQHWIFDTTSLKYALPVNCKLAYTTAITIYADEKLVENDCSLNLPKIENGPLPQHEVILHFKYQDSQSPGFTYTIELIE